MRELNKSEINDVSGGFLTGALDGASAGMALGQQVVADKEWNSVISYAFSAAGAVIGGIFGSEATAKFFKLFY
ncbi:Uncharacterised protein [Leminorella richardii]|uniref:Bacteriocin class II with double-glycine leader peptide n=1 Tax=Leminorella richardii TaxID=158841 RepID=A0A2X4UXK3_9GAMM|nr:hypothetical protein [Leminorella richardii]SQI40508.1 Uncharacterised protein [Leminorella richardii]